MPDLLQTEDYARAVVTTAETGDAERLESLVDLRVERQEVIDQPPVELCFVMDESAIHRMVGTVAVAREQLYRLLELAEYPNVTIRIVPFTRGIYPQMGMPYVLFEFDDGHNPAMYLEVSPCSSVVDEPTTGRRDRQGAPETGLFMAEFQELTNLTGQAETLDTIASALNDLR